MASWDPHSDKNFDPQNGGFRKPKPLPKTLNPLAPSFRSLAAQLLGTPNSPIDLKSPELRAVTGFRQRMFDLAHETRHSVVPADPYAKLSSDKTRALLMSTLYSEDGDDKVTYAIPASLFAGNSAEILPPDKPKVELIREGAAAIVSLVDTSRFPDPPRRFLVANKVAFEGMEHGLTETLPFLRSSDGEIEVFQTVSPTLFVLALTRAHRYGSQHPCNPDAQRIMGKFTDYQFDPTTHQHAVDIQWVEIGGNTPYPSFRLDMGKVNERVVLRVCPDENAVIRTDVVDVQRN